MTLFLSSTASSSITGQDINVSAGAVMYWMDVAPRGV